MEKGQQQDLDPRRAEVAAQIPGVIPGGVVPEAAQQLHADDLFETVVPKRGEDGKSIIEPLFTQLLCEVVELSGEESFHIREVVRSLYTVDSVRPDDYRPIEKRLRVLVSRGLLKKVNRHGRYAVQPDLVKEVERAKSTQSLHLRINQSLR